MEGSIDFGETVGMDGLSAGDTLKCTAKLDVYKRQLLWRRISRSGTQTW